MKNKYENYKFLAFELWKSADVMIKMSDLSNQEYCAKIIARANKLYEIYKQEEEKIN